MEAVEAVEGAAVRRPRRVWNHLRPQTVNWWQPAYCNTVKQNNQTTDFVGQLNASGYETPSMLTFSLLNPDGSDAGQTLTTAKGGIVTITDPTTGLFTYQADTRPGDKRGRDTFEFQVSDPDNAIARATETVIVNQAIMLLGDSITHGVNCIGGTQANGRCITDGFLPFEETAAIARHYTKA